MNLKFFSFVWPRSTGIVVSFALVVSLWSGCGARRTPDLQRIFESAREREGKRPIIIIPGILGSQLVNRQTGETVWPSAYRSTVDGLGLPMTPDLANNRDNLYATKILETIRLARLIPAEVYIYYELLNALRNFAGYREGHWDAPAADGDRDTFYVFAYDWRRDNVETARQLISRIEELKRKLKRPDLRFNILAHSMGGLVARYATMYGDSDLPPAGQAPQPTWAGATAISKVFMFGVPNQGSAEAFATLLEGYSVTEGLRRRVRLLNKLSRDDAMAIPSLYQLMPHGHSARFLDENFQPLEIDLYDPATWKRYAWASIHDPVFRERYVQGKTRDEDAPRLARLELTARSSSSLEPLTSPAPKYTLEELDSYFAAALARARRFHEALNASGTTSMEPPPVALFAFGGDCEETLSAPVILRDEKRGTWVTLTNPRAFRRTSGQSVSRKDVTRMMYEPGDGRVTRRSLLGEGLGAPRASGLFNTALPIAYAAFACDLHSELQKNKTLQDNALTILVNEAVK